MKPYDLPELTKLFSNSTQNSIRLTRTRIEYALKCLFEPNYGITYVGKAIIIG